MPLIDFPSMDYTGERCTRTINTDTIAHLEPKPTNKDHTNITYTGGETITIHLPVDTVKQRIQNEAT